MLFVTRLCETKIYWVCCVSNNVTIPRHTSSRDQRRSQRRSDEGIIITITLRPHCVCYAQVLLTSEFRGNGLMLIVHRKFLPVEQKHLGLGWPTISKGGCRGILGFLGRVAKASSTMGVGSYQDHTVRVKTQTRGSWSAPLSPFGS
jgi:hypothetical protein